MCRGIYCPISTKCHRYTAKPDRYMQSYGDFTYVDGNCDYFWDNKNEL